MPPSCQCLPAHPPIRGFNEREEFRSSSSLAFGKQFWWFSVPPFCSILRNEALSSSRASSFSPGSHGFSFASSSGSKAQLYIAWCSGELTKAIFGDYGGSTAASKYFAGVCPPLDLPGCRSSLSSPSHHPLSSSLSSLQASCSSCGPLCALLVALPPRGDVSDGCGATPGSELWSGAHQATRLDGVSFVFLR